MRKLKTDKLGRFYQAKKEFLSGQYLLLTFFWIIFTVMMIVALYLFIQERTTVNSMQEIYDIKNVQLKQPDLTNEQKQALYKRLMDLTQYNIISFSLLDFQIWKSEQPILDWEATWNQRETAINLAYSYVFICGLLALITLCFYITINVKYFRQSHFIKRYDLEHRYQFVSVSMFNTKMYLNFVSNLTIIFTFFNFLTTLVSLAYGILLVIVSEIARIGFKTESEALLPRKFWKTTNFKFFSTVLIIQNTYTLAKSYFLIKFEVNIDLLIQIIIPIGTITVILAVYIRNLLNSSVTAIKNSIKTIDKRVYEFETFLYSQKEECLKDFTFHKQLPIIILNLIKSEDVSIVELHQALREFDKDIKFFRQYIKKPEQINYVLYHLFNVVKTSDEIDELKNNVIKLHQSNINYS